MKDWKPTAAHDSRVASPVATFSGPICHPSGLSPPTVFSEGRRKGKSHLIISQGIVVSFADCSTGCEGSQVPRLHTGDPASCCPPMGPKGGHFYIEATRLKQAASSLVWYLVWCSVRSIRGAVVSAASRPSPLSSVASSSAGNASKRAILSPASSFLLHLTRDATRRAPR